MKLTLIIIALTLVSCGSKKYTFDDNANPGVKTIELCPGMVSTGWGGSDLQQEVGLIIEGKLYADFWLNNGTKMGFGEVPSSVSCEDVLNDTSKYSHLVASCLALDSNVYYHNGQAFHIGTGNFASSNEDGQCIFKHINDTKARTITIWRLMSRNNSSCVNFNASKPLKPCSTFEVLGSATVKY